MTGLSLTTRRAARRHRVRYSFLFMRASGAQLDEITKLIDTKVLRPIIDRAYPFDEAPQALAHVESSRTKGKVVSQRSDAHQTRYADISGVSPSLSLHLQRAAIRAPRARFRPSARPRLRVRGAPAADELRASRGSAIRSRAELLLWKTRADAGHLAMRGGRYLGAGVARDDADRRAR
jgi:Zinc-binding dehydrogenase